MAFIAMAGFLERSWQVLAVERGWVAATRHDAVEAEALLAVGGLQDAIKVRGDRAAVEEPRKNGHRPLYCLWYREVSLE